MRERLNRIRRRGSLVQARLFDGARTRRGQAVRGYITNEYGEPAEPLRMLAQALDASGAVVGQQIAWLPEGVGGFERSWRRLPSGSFQAT